MARWKISKGKWDLYKKSKVNSKKGRMKLKLKK